jgi:hypothetical protein
MAHPGVTGFVFSMFRFSRLPNSFRIFLKLFFVCIRPHASDHSPNLWLLNAESKLNPPSVCAVQAAMRGMLGPVAVDPGAEDEPPPQSVHSSHSSLRS